MTQGRRRCRRLRSFHLRNLDCAAGARCIAFAAAAGRCWPDQPGSAARPAPRGEPAARRHRGEDRRAQQAAAAEPDDRSCSPGSATSYYQRARETGDPALLRRAPSAPSRRRSRSTRAASRRSPGRRRSRSRAPVRRRPRARSPRAPDRARRSSRRTRRWSTAWSRPAATAPPRTALERFVSVKPRPRRLLAGLLLPRAPRRPRRRRRRRCGWRSPPARVPRRARPTFASCSRNLNAHARPLRRGGARLPRGACDRPGIGAAEAGLGAAERPGAASSTRRSQRLRAHARRSSPRPTRSPSSARSSRPRAELDAARAPLRRRRADRARADRRRASGVDAGVTAVRGQPRRGRHSRSSSAAGPGARLRASPRPTPTRGRCTAPAAIEAAARLSAEAMRLGLARPEFLYHAGMIARADGDRAAARSAARRACCSRARGSARCMRPGRERALRSLG